jgi:drug/metabolite transporter (DMT)-like permease
MGIDHRENPLAGSAMSEPGPIPRKQIDGYAASLMTVLCLCWALQQVVTKAAAHAMNPVLQVGIRSFVAALLVAGLMSLRRDRIFRKDGTLWPGILVGLLFGGEVVGVSLGLQYTTAGHMAVFLYTAPVFTAVGLHLGVKSERLSPRQWWGVILAFGGMALGYSGSFFVEGGKDMIIGDLLGMLGGLFWAGTTIVIRRSSLAETSSSKTLLYQLGGAAIILLPMAYFSGHFNQVVPSGLLWWNLAFQSVVITFGSYLIWFQLLRKYLATRLSVFSFLTPIFGVALGVMVLNEPLDSRFVAGSILVLAGIALVSRKV